MLLSVPIVMTLFQTPVNSMSFLILKLQLNQLVVQFVRMVLLQCLLWHLEDHPLLSINGNIIMVLHG